MFLDIFSFFFWCDWDLKKAYTMKVSIEIQRVLTLIVVIIIWLHQISFSSKFYLSEGLELLVLSCFEVIRTNFIQTSLGCVLADNTWGLMMHCDSKPSIFFSQNAVNQLKWCFCNLSYVTCKQVIHTTYTKKKLSIIASEYD